MEIGDEASDKADMTAKQGRNENTLKEVSTKMDGCLLYGLLSLWITPIHFEILVIL